MGQHHYGTEKVLLGSKNSQKLTKSAFTGIDLSLLWLQLTPPRPATRPAGARSGSRPAPCAGPASPWARVSGTPPGDTRADGCSGPSRARSPRRCRPTCCGRWATQVGLSAGVASPPGPHGPVLLRVELDVVSCPWSLAPVVGGVCFCGSSNCLVLFTFCVLFPCTVSEVTRSRLWSVSLLLTHVNRHSTAPARADWQSSRVL